MDQRWSPANINSIAFLWIFIVHEQVHVPIWTPSMVQVYGEQCDMIMEVQCSAVGETNLHIYAVVAVWKTANTANKRCKVLDSHACHQSVDRSKTELEQTFGPENWTARTMQTSMEVEDSRRRLYEPRPRDMDRHLLSRVFGTSRSKLGSTSTVIAA